MTDSDWQRNDVKFAKNGLDPISIELQTIEMSGMAPFNLVHPVDVRACMSLMWCANAGGRMRLEWSAIVTIAPLKMAG